MLSVSNGYKNGWTGENKIYIGRRNKKLNLYQSPLSNPFVISASSDRSTVIEKYRIWLYKQIKNETSAYRYLQTLIPLHKSHIAYELVCYCHPKECHGDIIIKAVNWLIRVRHDL